MLSRNLRFVALTIVGLVLLPQGVLAEDCAYGAYSGKSGQVVALTRPAKGGGPGARYTFLDGRRGHLSDADAPLQCDSGRLRARDDAAGWSRVPVRATPTRFRSGDAVLNGMLLQPVGVSLPPLVVLVHGSEKTSPIGQATSYLFISQGVAVFAYDKRGTADSGGVYTQDFIALADDAANAGREARRLAGKRIGRFGFLGGSQGGWVAPLAALKSNADFLEVGFGVVGTALEQDQWQVDYQLITEHGHDPSILPKVHALTDATADVARSGFQTSMDKVVSLKREFSDEPWLNDVDGQYSGGLLAGEVDRMRAESPQVPWTYSGLDVIRSLRVPQLWVFAADDDVAPSAPSIERLATIGREGTPIHSIVFPNTSHGILQIEKHADGSRRNLNRYAPGYLQLLVDFAKGSAGDAYGDARWLERR